MSGSPSDSRCRLRSSSAGFTLLEVMVALMIIAIALVALLGSQAGSIDRAGETAFNNIAPLLASAKLAEVEGGLLPAVDKEGDFSPDRPEYRWRLKVGAPVVGGKEPMPGLRAAVWRVEVTVTREGTSHSYALTSYVGKNRDMGLRKGGR